MRVGKMSEKLVRLFFALLVGVFVAAFAPGASTVQASSQTVIIEDEDVAAAETSDEEAPW